MKPRDIMSKGIMYLMRKSPFYSTITVKQEIIEDDSIDAPMGTNGTQLIYNPNHISKLKTTEVYEILKHEAMHVANKHHIRMKTLKPKYKNKIEKYNIDYHTMFNVASDLAINSILAYIDHTCTWDWSELLKAGCIPGQGKFDHYPKNESSEFYMKMIMDEIDQAKPEQRQDIIEAYGLDKAQTGGVMEALGDPAIEEEIANSNIASASIMSRGSKDKDCQSAINMIAEYNSEPRLNWKAELDRFIKERTKGRPNYRKPNRRYESVDFIIPSNVDHKVNKIVLLVDVSGSMSNEAVASVYKHMTNIVKHSRDTDIIMVPFDDEVFTKYERVFNKRNIPIKEKDKLRHSYGGTLYTEAIKYADSKKPSGIIMLTDLMPYDIDEFNNYKIKSAFLMLSVLKASDIYLNDEDVQRYTDAFKNKRIIEVDI